MTPAAFLEMHEPLWVYLSIPLLAAFVGYVTKLLMIEMLFRPLEFKGLVDPWLGWQGQVPRNAAKMAVTTVDSLQENLLDPRELIDLVDVDDLLRELEGPLNATVAEITEEIAEQYQPRIWGAMPDVAKRALIARLRGHVPGVTRRLIEELRENFDQVFDLKYTVVTSLTRDKSNLTRLFRGLGGDTFGFMRKSGLIFGFVIGVVQAFALLATHEELILPLFGLLTGGLTDWLALQMVFRPVRPGRFLGFPWQGRFHKLRPEITRDYAGVMAKDILTPAMVLEGVLTGPMSDRLYGLIEAEVHKTIDEQAPALARPLVRVAVGGERYQEIKEAATTRALEHLPANLSRVSDYAERTVDLQTLLAERMERMTDEQYEDLLRPIFKDQEWVVIVLGAALGFVFGELQVHVLLS